MTSRLAVATREAPPTLGGVVVGSPEVRRALVFSLWDGAFASGMIALTETFGIAAAVVLKAPSMAIALLGSLPLLLGSLGQFFLPAFVDFRQARKTQVLWSVGLQSALLFVTALSGFIAPPFAAWAYVASFVLAGLFANITTASWVSWMGDLVNSHVRARHFAWRSRIFAVVNLSCAMVAGITAAGYSSQNAPWAFFTAIFVCAAALRALSFQMLKRQYEPPVELPVKRPPLRANPSRDFRTFAFAHALVQGAAAMSSPFFTVWYLRDLQFSYLALAITSCSMIVGSIISLPLWGKLTDRIGNRSTLRLAGLLVGLIPLGYLAFTSTVAIWLINVGAGVAWAGYNLVSFNQLLSATESGNRARLFALASAIGGVVVFAMTLLGGFLAPRLPLLFTWQLQSLFLLSAIFRLGTFWLFFPHLHEYVPPAGQGAADLFNQIPGYRVGLGLFRNVFRAFRG